MEAIGSVVEVVGRLLWSGRQTKHKLPVFEGNVFVKAVFQTREAIYSISVPIIKYYIVYT